MATTQSRQKNQAATNRKPLATKKQKDSYTVVSTANRNNSGLQVDSLADIQTAFSNFLGGNENAFSSLQYFGNNTLRYEGGDVLPEDQLPDVNVGILNTNISLYALYPDPTFLLNSQALLDNSPTLNGIIEKLADLVINGGFKIETKTDKAAKKVLHALTKRRNLQGDTVKDILRKNIVSYLGLGNFYDELVKTKTGKIGDLYLYARQVRECRPKVDRRTNIASEIGINAFWINQNDAAVTIKKYPYWSKETVQPEVQEQSDPNKPVKESSMIHVYRFKDGWYYYGAQCWLSARAEVALDYYASLFNRDQFRKGFRADGIVTIEGNFPDKETEAAKIKAQFMGNTAEQKTIVVIGPAGVKGATFTPIAIPKEGGYLELQSSTKRKICDCFGVPPAFFGEETAGKLGDANQKAEMYEEVNVAVVRPLQEMLIERVVEPYLTELARVTGDNDYTNVEVGLKKLSPITLASQVDPMQVLEKYELREILGYEAVPTPPEGYEVSNEQNDPV